MDLFSLTGTKYFNPLSADGSLLIWFKKKLKVSGFRPPPSLILPGRTSAGSSQTPHHGVTHGSNVLVDKSHSRPLTRIRSADLENTSSAHYQLSIYIPRPFPPVWGVADNTKETNKNNGGFTPFLQQ